MFNKLIIRLWKKGKSRLNTIYYRIVVSKRNARFRSKFRATIGFYSPSKTQRRLYVDGHALGYWLNRGAVMNKSVLRLFSRMAYIKR